MKKVRIVILLILCQLFGLVTVSAQERRPIDSQHPLWLVHVDVWNQADPQKIINLIPDDIKPYVCMNLSLSCSYDTEKNVYIRPQNAIRTYKSWATVCQQNGMWFTCQPASGGHTHIQDDDLETFEYFFKHYPNFLGWNYAEQFWGFDEAGDKSSSSQTSRIALFAKLVPMSHKYGGFLTVSFCGNIWSHPLNPVGMMKRNSELMAACKQYPEAILWLYKYTTSSCFYNNESVTFGPFASGLAKNYGVRYDNCGYNGALDALLGDNHGKKYPVSAGIGTVMEQTCQNGGAVWDGPELIWTEDFQNLANTTVSGYTQRNWGTYPGFRNIWMDMFRKIIDGTMYIPTQQEVIDKTKIIVVNEVSSGSDEDKYAAWGDLYDNLYKQTDPFNPNGGQWMNNYCYFKSTGRYGTIPITPSMTEMSQGIPTKVRKSTRTSTWSTLAKKKAAFDAAYPVVSTGDLFVSRYKNQLVTYTPYSYINSKKSATANIPLQYNTCTSLDLTLGELAAGIVKEYADSITFYLNNYRTDTTALTSVKLDKIVVNGATSKPSYSLVKRVAATATVSDEWDETTGTYTLSVTHNGPLDIVLHCQGAETDRATDVVSSTPLETPKQPEEYSSTVIKEAEDMDFKSVSSVETTPYYSGYNSVRGHAGNGFVVMGTSTSGSLKTTVTEKVAGSYKVSIRYTSASSDKTSGNIRVAMNGVNKYVSLPKTATNEWKKASYTATNVKAGSNTFVITNSAGRNIYIDQVIFTPADEAEEEFGVAIHEADNGVATADCETAAEGDTVTVSLQPSEGYALDSWNVIHGGITPTENVDGTYSFVMPDDNVTLQPVFKDTTTVYALNYDDALAGSLPVGWRATESASSTHEYPNTYSSGPRIMGGFSGTYTKALYWRTISADYGMQADYPLTLAPGKYKMTYAMAAWKGTPSCMAEIVSDDGTILAKTSYYTAAPNANGSSSANLSTAVQRTLEFTVTNAGNYSINFLNNGTGFSEFLLLACQINKVVEVLKGDVNGDGQVNIADVNAIIAVMCGGTYNPKADVNGDGSINISDVNAVIAIMCGQ